MAGRQAKTLTAAQEARLLAWCDVRRYPKRDRVVVLLSVKAGLRAMEIARILRRHVTDAEGRVDEVIHLEDKLCKKGSGGVIPMAPALREAIAAHLEAEAGWLPNTPLVRSERAWRADGAGDGAMHTMSPSSIAFIFFQAYRDLGFTGCSSHSGRRTFITRAARNITKAGGSLRDVQQLARHASLQVTQRYIEGDEAAKRRVVELI